VPRATIQRLAEADAFHVIAESRRQGLWMVKGFGEAPPLLFAAAGEREAQFSPEGLEPTVALWPLIHGPGLSHCIRYDARRTNELQVIPGSRSKWDAAYVNFTSCKCGVAT